VKVFDFQARTKAVSRVAGLSGTDGLRVIDDEGYGVGMNRTPVVRRLSAGLLAAAAAICIALMSSAGRQAGADDRNASGPLENTGNEPGDAFYFDLRQGFDEDEHWKANYVMDAPWFATGYTPRNVRFDKHGMTLVIQNKRMQRQPYTGAEFQISGFYGFGRYETIMKAAKGSGVVSSFFTHTDDYFDDPHDEIDFEFLGKNTRAVELNYFAGKRQQGAKTIKLDYDAAEEFHLYAFEWTPTYIKWFIDGKLVHEVHGSNAKTPIPRSSQRVIANIWAAKGTALQWTGPVEFETASAQYLCMSHVPMGRRGKQCADTFKP
jgi:endo-1,3-1,4-beta-glycanase ExoK